MTIARLALAGLVASAAGCHAPSNHTSTNEHEASQERGAVGGKADALEGSCQQGARLYCGERSQGSCWCDELCTYYGDCCSDKADTCDLPATLRMADVLSPHPNAYPIFFDSSTPELIGVPLRMEVSRPEALPPRSYTGPLDEHAMLEGRLMSLNPAAYVTPCNGLSPEECDGPLEVSIWSDNEPSVLLARRQVSLASMPTDPLSAAPCMGVGNVARYDFATGYLGASGIGTTTSTQGTWRVSRGEQNFGVPIWRILASTHTKVGGSVSFDFAIPQDVPVGVPVDAWSTPGAGDAWVHYQGSCGHGQLVINELDLGEAIDANDNWIRRISIGWQLECAAFKAGEKVVKTVNGCVHYDADNPVIMWEK